MNSGQGGIGFKPSMDNLLMKKNRIRKRKNNIKLNVTLIVRYENN